MAAMDRYMVIPTDAAYVVVKVMSLHDSVAEAALEVKRLKAEQSAPSDSAPVSLRAELVNSPYWPERTDE